MLEVMMTHSISEELRRKIFGFILVHFPRYQGTIRFTMAGPPVGDQLLLAAVHANGDIQVFISFAILTLIPYPRTRAFGDRAKVEVASWQEELVVELAAAIRLAENYCVREDWRKFEATGCSWAKPER